MDVFIYKSVSINFKDIYFTLTLGQEQSSDKYAYLDGSIITKTPQGTDYKIKL